jgi:DNA polymerase III alpha subunit
MVKIDNHGTISLNVEDVFESLYSGNIKNLDQFSLDTISVVEQFNNAINSNADSIPKLKIYKPIINSVELFDQKNQSQWFMPKDYFPNLVEYLLDKCENEEQYSRVTQELELFIQHGMYDLLHYLKYLVDIMRENNIVWGVGRGSSVASYVLYLLGIHKIDSIKYELDIKEFLK